MLSFLVGIAASIAVGLAVTIVARTTATADASSFWGWEATAMGLGLVFVGAIVIAAAWTMVGALKVIGDPGIALTVGGVTSFGIVLLAAILSTRRAKPSSTSA